MAMLITLERGDLNSTFIIRADDGRDLLIQADWEYPSTAQTFGWSLEQVKPDDDRIEEAEEHLEEVRDKIARGRPGYDRASLALAEATLGQLRRQRECRHRETDGTTQCPDCGMTVGEFIGAAYEWLRENNGTTVEDPGYFTDDLDYPDEDVDVDDREADDESPVHFDERHSRCPRCGEWLEVCPNCTRRSCPRCVRGECPACNISRDSVEFLSVAPDVEDAEPLARFDVEMPDDDDDDPFAEDSDT